MHAVEHDAPACQEGEHGAPSEPPQSVRDQASGHGAFGAAAQLASEKGRLDEVEVVEDPDPGDPGKNVEPAQQYFDAVAARDQIHECFPLLEAGRPTGLVRASFYPPATRNLGAFANHVAKYLK